MADVTERAALVTLLRGGRLPWQRYAEMIEQSGSALTVLDQERGLLAREALAAELTAVTAWEADGLRMITITDPEYPANLRTVHDRPPMIFVAGELTSADDRSVAVIGSRRATPPGLAAARSLSEHLVRSGYTVVSGLAAGIDAAAHTKAIECGGRTVAVIGTGLNQCYPPEHRRLQHAIAREGAVVSQFWPDAPPTRQSFPLRNAVMSGLALATVIVEATMTSGSRVQARRALAHGRPVLLRKALLSQPWARELADKPGVHVVSSPAQITDTIERLTSPGALTG